MVEEAMNGVTSAFYRPFTARQPSPRRSRRHAGTYKFLVAVFTPRASSGRCEMLGLLALRSRHHFTLTDRPSTVKRFLLVAVFNPSLEPTIIMRQYCLWPERYPVIWAGVQRHVDEVPKFVLGVGEDVERIRIVLLETPCYCALWPQCIFAALLVSQNS